MGNQKKTLGHYAHLLEKEGLLEGHIPNNVIMENAVIHVTYDSRKVCPGTLFVCKGAHFEPEYLREAVAKGAVAYIAMEEYPEGGSIPCLQVLDIRKALALLANDYYEEPWRNLTLVGVTGTKGKSTTTYYIKSILDEYLTHSGGKMSGILSGIQNYDGVIDEESHLTTPETFELHEHFCNAVDSGITHLAMEVSSQALKYHRTLGIPFQVGIFLNIGQDHISQMEHPDFEDYLDAKLQLFSQCDTAVIPQGGPYFHQIWTAAKENASNVVTFGRDSTSDFWGHSLVSHEGGTRFFVKTQNHDEPFEITMKGDFNVDNALAAIAASSLLGIPVATIRKGLEKAKVPGRMEVFYDRQKDCIIYVDYAHNQLSFETLFHSIKDEYPDRWISIVFGCPGKKALGRRRELGEIAGKNAQKVFITEEDAGEEPLDEISEEIAVYVAKEKTPYEIIPDREQAIYRAIQSAPTYSVVLITGKGRETRQKRGTEYIDTPSDVEIVERVISHER